MGTIKRTAMAVIRFCQHVIRAAKALATDKSLPKWLRIVLVIACLPIPGPVDNAVQVAVLVIIAIWYRPALVTAWTGTRSSTPASEAPVNGPVFEQCATPGEDTPEPTITWTLA